MGYSWGNTSKKRMEGVSERLVLCATRMLAKLPIDATIPQNGGMRTVAIQKDLYKRKVSKCDGVKKLSRHQLITYDGTRALDIIPYISGVGGTYNDLVRFAIIGSFMLQEWEIMKSERLVKDDEFLHWGGLWTPNKSGLGWDPAHYEISDKPQYSKLKS